MMSAETLPGFIPSLFWGIVTLSFVVFVHEGGHYLAARLMGLEVSEFMIGLPGPKLSWVWGGTRYGITAIPFGGYVRIPALEGSGPGAELGLMTPEERAVYEGIPMWRRVVTLIAGIVMNLVLAVLILTLVLSLWGRQVDRGYVDPVAGGPAAVAGLAVGDRVVSVDGIAIDGFDQLVAVVGSAKVGDSVRVEFVHAGVGDRVDEAGGGSADGGEAGGVGTGGSGEAGGELETATIVLGAHPEAVGSDGSPLPYLGVSPHFVTERMPLGAALGQSFRFIGMTAEGIVRLFSPSTFRETIDQSASVIGISVVAAQAARSSMWEYATLVAAISLSLGLMNLLPIPPLDGGKITLELIQKATGRPVNQKLLVGISLCGFALVVCLMIFVTFNDVARLLK